MKSLLHLLQPVGSLKGNMSKSEEDLAAILDETANDPLLFVHKFFHWGEGDLAKFTGPDEWQTELLSRMKEKLKEEGLQAAIRFAVSSGHGVGKSALVSWLVLWFISTRPNSQIVVTANTQTQLSTKTWREVSRWLHRMLHRHWFQWQATRLFHVLKPDTWYASAIPWSENNPEAFAGTHETAGVLILFDEASAIADIIWENIEGALTTAGAMWCVFGNPTRNSGYFYECFNRFSHRWIHYKVDSRKAHVANQVQIQQWIDDYGEDSDFVRVRVRGEFPRTSVNQFIPTGLTKDSMARKLLKEAYYHSRPIIGVDVARFGEDRSVIVCRKGSWVDPKMDVYLGIDTMTLAGYVLARFRDEGSNALVCVDGVGVGAGVVDRLREQGVPVIDVQSSHKSFDPRTYFNKRCELYGKLKEWMQQGGALPDNRDLLSELSIIEYQINKQLQIQLASKEDIRKMNDGKSTDLADPIAYTFAVDSMLSITQNSRARTVVPTLF